MAGTHGTYTGLGNGTSVDETANLRSPQSAQRLRGLAAADNTRDFFVTDIPWDSFNVDRIDINRGANSFLFGLGSPAGIVNASTRNAGFTTGGDLQGRVGSYGSWRSTVDFNQVLIPDTLAVRFDGLWGDEKYQQKQAFQNDRRYYGAIRFDPKLFSQNGWHTSIKAKYKHGDIDANRPRQVPPNDSITPWWRPTDVTTSNPFGGMGQQVVTNGYDLGVDLAAFNPWLGSVVNQQQPMWLIDGTTGQLQKVTSGYINNGAKDTSGNFNGISSGIAGKRYAEQLFRLVSLDQAAKAMNLPGSEFGQFRTQSLMDSSVFDFYNTLLDGPTKSEFERWDAYNVDFSQTALDDRVGVQVIYDNQRYTRGGEALLGGSPTLTIDILRNPQDFYLTPNANGETSITNPNFGRPFVTAGQGSGSSYTSERKYWRASLFGELRAADMLHNDFLVKLLGKHRFNGVYSKEDYSTETRGWVEYANPREWAGFWNGNDGSGSSITDRGPVGVIYLGSSLVDTNSSSGVDIPGIKANVKLADSSVYLMDSTWQNYGVGFDDPWVPPAGLQLIYPVTNADGDPIMYAQNSNPANYVGWNSNRQINLLRYNDGADLSLLTRSQLSQRETNSLAGSWQGYFWNDAIVTTLGWRFDEVKSRAINAKQQGNNRSILNLNPDVYTLPDNYDPPGGSIFKDHSTAGSIVVHLNQLLGDRDPLPINIGLSYTKSNNFTVTDARRDIYGNVIGNPTGSTKDYGVLLSTKDNKYTFRAVKYETTVKGGSSGIGDPGGIGRVIQQGLRFRNVFLYDMGGYDWSTRNQPQSRNSWGTVTRSDGTTYGADANLTPEEGRALEDQAITTWNQIQTDLTAKGFFQAWGFDPVPLQYLTDRSTYEASLDANGDPPAQFLPPSANVYAYGSSPPPGFTVTADTISKGYEFELTANPLPNWRVSFNASQTEAVRSNVGGQLLDDFITYLDEKLTNMPAGNMPQFGNTSLSIYANVYGPWRSNYVLMKLQEGASAPEIRKWRYNFVTNYTFQSGFLRNVGLGGSYHWIDKVVIGYPVTSTGSFDLSQPVLRPLGGFGRPLGELRTPDHGEDQLEDPAEHTQRVCQRQPDPDLGAAGWQDVGHRPHTAQPGMVPHEHILVLRPETSGGAGRGGSRPAPAPGACVWRSFS